MELGQCDGEYNLLEVGLSARELLERLGVLVEREDEGECVDEASDDCDEALCRGKMHGPFAELE